MELAPGIFRASWAVCKKQWITYIRYPSWFISLLIWPVLFPFGYIFASKALAGPDGIALATFSSYAGTTDYAGFIAIGTAFWMWFNMMLWGFGGALRSEQMRGTLESNFLAPLPKAFLLIGSFAAEAMMGLLMLTVSAMTLYAVYGVRCVGSLWHLAVIAVVSIPSLYGVGMIFASLVLVAKETNAFIFFVRGVMTVFCGVTYPIAVLPQWMQAISRSLPLTHSIQAIRYIVAGGHLVDLTTEIGYLLISGTILLAGGYVTFMLVERHMLKSGTVGQY